jgi:hypothetical protein
MTTARERIAKFCTVYEKIHPRQPLEDSIYGLNTGEPTEAELTLSDLKQLLAEADPETVAGFKAGDSVKVIDPNTESYGKRGWVTLQPDGKLASIGGTLNVVFETGGRGYFIPSRLEKEN